MAGRKLTAKQRLFVEACLAGENATQAAIKAGYSEKTAASIGAENLRKPQIAILLEARVEEVAKKADLTAEGILDRLQETYESAREEGQHNAANKSLELQGKFLGIWVDKQQIDVGPTLAQLLETGDE